MCKITTNTENKTKINQIKLNPNERIDDLQCGGYKIIQNPDGFCFGIDAACLSNFATVKKGETVLDLCTGTAAIPILLAAKTQAKHITGIEISAKSVDMARRSITLNNLNDRIHIDLADIKNAMQLYKPSSFDVITVNPPYIIANGGLHNKSDDKTIARHEITCTLHDIITISAKLLKTGGRLYMVHRPHRLPEIICQLTAAKLEPKTLQIAQATLNHNPSLIFIEAIDHANPMLKIKPVLLLNSDK
ncbi:MAG: methyltransferase [Defluviitaleaceae bacterium]|nr:methyltransferase [Defluviitaleaceae bacterium]